tara:strand:- start:4816 stop:5235 length:420 start_codon:yes stop_codon:yes gene_type:complete
VSIWKSKSSFLSKPWGDEEHFSSPFGMSGKIITLKANKRTSLKYYDMKNQLIYCLEGHVRVFAKGEKEFGDIDGEDGNYFNLHSGDIILIQAQSPYRITAIEDSKMLEVLNGSPGARDGFVMLEDDYGRKLNRTEINCR